MVVRLGDMTVSWKSTKQVQVPRSTAEAEVAAMAYAGQYLEGTKSLYESMGVLLNVPTLFCDNRAACYISQGSGEWRTKALINRVLGLRSLAGLKIIVINFKPTAEMAADILTKYTKKNVLQRCRDLVGCVEFRGLQGPRTPPKRGSP